MNTFPNFEAWMGTVGASFGRFLDQARMDPPAHTPVATNGHAKPKALASSNGHAKAAPTKIVAAQANAKPVKKAAPKAAAPKVKVEAGKFGAKSTFIRSMPDATAREIVEAGEAQGIKITAAHVYNVRAMAKQSGPPKVAKAKAAPAPKAPKAPKAVKAKAAPAPKAPKAAKPAPAKGSKGEKIAAGRRAVADGLRPKVVDSIAIVMGKETMGSAAVVEALEKRGWLPGSSTPQSYISYMMSDNSDVFERVDRGLYKVIDPAKYAKIAKEFESASGGKTSGKAERVASTNTGTEAKTEESSAAAPVASDPPPQASETVQSQAFDNEDVLGSLGEENPFGDNVVPS